MAAKKNFSVRDIPVEDYNALERMRLRLRMPREQFGRTLIHLVAWNLPGIFHKELGDALGPDRPPDEPVSEEDEAADTPANGAA